MKQIQKFLYESREIRSLLIDGDPWFVAKDVCDVLDVGNPSQALTRLDDDEKNTIILNEGNRGNPSTVVVSEPGLYTLILGSRKPEAKQFKRWITHEVIPSIRRTGTYGIPTNLPDALRLAAEIEEQRVLLEQKIELDKPKTIFADAVSASPDSILVGQLATFLKQNGVNIGQQRLFQWLRDEGYLCKNGERKNLPTQKSMEMNLFEVKEFTVNGNSGSRIRQTPKVTGRGQIYFLNKFLNRAS